MYQFERLLFGLCNVPETFQRLMDEVITPDLKPNVFCYLDDIIIITQNFDDSLRSVFVECGRKRPPTMDPTSSWLLPRSTAIGCLNEEDTMSSKHLWWGPFTSTFCEHCLRYLNLVLDKINEENSTIEPTKSEFGCSGIRYLGFEVNKKGLQINDDKIQPILEFTNLINIKQLQRLIGMAS